MTKWKTDRIFEESSKKLTELQRAIEREMTLRGQKIQVFLDKELDAQEKKYLEDFFNEQPTPFYPHTQPEWHWVFERLARDPNPIASRIVNRLKL